MAGRIRRTRTFSWLAAVGAVNLCTGKQAVFAEIRRVLRPGGTLQSADIANSRAISSEALRDIDLWAA